MQPPSRSSVISMSESPRGKKLNAGMRWLGKSHALIHDMYEIVNPMLQIRCTEAAVTGAISCSCIGAHSRNWNDGCLPLLLCTLPYQSVPGWRVS